MWNINHLIFSVQFIFVISIITINSLKLDIYKNYFEKFVYTNLQKCLRINW